MPFPFPTQLPSEELSETNGTNATLRFGLFSSFFVKRARRREGEQRSDDDVKLEMNALSSSTALFITGSLFSIFHT